MKKKILFLILATFITFVGVSNVSAECTNGNVDYGDNLGYDLAQFDFLDEKGACLYGLYDGDTAVGIRLTIVDMSGTRVSGTNSVDLTNGHRTFTGAPFSSKNVSPGGKWYAGVGTKKDRYEVVSSGMDYVAGSSLLMYYWPNLPKIDGDTLSKFFETQFAQAYKSDMVQIFALMNYTGYTDARIASQHYLLVEPIFMATVIVPKEETRRKGSDINTIKNTHLNNGSKDNVPAVSAKSEKDISDNNFSLPTFLTALYNFFTGGADETNRTSKSDSLSVFDSWVKQKAGTDPAMRSKIMNATFCDFRRRYYFGTTTEIYSMMKQNKDTGIGKDSINTMAKNFAKRIYVKATTANLKAAGDTENSNVWTRAISDFGVGSGHIWMSHIVCEEDCPPPTCPDGSPLPPDGDISKCNGTCPDGSPLPPDGDISKCNTCPLKPTVTLVNDCEEGPTSSVVDSNNWACIFKTKALPANTYEGNFYNVNGVDLSTNDYCSVACREEIHYTFSGPFAIDAGSRFTIGNYTSDMFNLDPGRMSGTSVCRTAPKNGTEYADAKINYTKFLSDYADANRAVAKAWDLYQFELKKQASIDATHTSETKTGTHGYSSCSSDPHRYNTCDDPLVQYHVNLCELLGNTGCRNGCKDIEEPYGEDACPGTRYYSHADGSTTTSKEYTYTIKTSTYAPYYVGYDGTVYRDNPNTYAVDDDGHGCGKAGNSLSPNVSGAKLAYENAVAYRDGILATLRQCNNFIRDYTDFAPEVTFSYEDPTYGGSFKLKQNSSVTANNTQYYKNDINVENANWLAGANTGNIYGSKDVTMSYVCNTIGSPCTPGSVIYPTNDYVIQTVQKTYTYNLETDLYRYMGKNGLQSSNTLNYNNIEYVESYKDYNSSLLPVSFSYPYCKSTQKYVYSYYYGYSGGKVLFGKDSKFTKYSDSIPGLQSGAMNSFEGVQYSDNVDYVCRFYVSQDFRECTKCDSSHPKWNPATQTCDDTTTSGGINIIYRPISLDDPFPGEHGKTKNPNGRAPGSNWSWSFENKKGEVESAVHAYITENRGVHTEQVYAETPIYEFILDPTNIRRIRKYNSEQKHDYTDFETLECYSSTAEFCRSTFLQKGLTEGYFQFTNSNPTGGTCFGKGGTTDDEWNACRYQH